MLSLMVVMDGGFAPIPPAKYARVICMTISQKSICSMAAKSLTSSELLSSRANFKLPSQL